MPPIDVKTATVERLKTFAEPLVDTFDTVINRALDALEGAPANAPSAALLHRRIFPAAAPPDLTHSKLLEATLGGMKIEAPTWNRLLDEAVRMAAQYGQRSSVDLKSVIPVRFVQGKKADHGFKPFPELGISVQSQDANGAWRGAFHIARNIGVGISATFVWREKEGAAFPGVTGAFEVSTAGEG